MVPRTLYRHSFPIRYQRRWFSLYSCRLFMGWRGAGMQFVCLIFLYKLVWVSFGAPFQYLFRFFLVGLRTECFTMNKRFDIRLISILLRRLFSFKILSTYLIRLFPIQVSRNSRFASLEGSRQLHRMRRVI